MSGSSRFLGCLAAAGVTASTAHGYSFLGELYNTGVDDHGAKLSTTTQTQDTHYSLASDPAGFDIAYAVGGYQGYWNTADYVDPTGEVFQSQWISPLWNNGQAGEVNNYPNNRQFEYTLDFNLAGAKSIDIKGQWMVDNGSNGAGLISQILVDGQTTGQQIAATGDQFEPFNHWHSFDLTGDYFKVGANSITFSVTNWPQDFGNPTGLRVAFTSADPTPEPFTFMLGAGALALGIGRRRARRA